jgi:hypothetical protein
MSTAQVEHLIVGSVLIRSMLKLCPELIKSASVKAVRA